MSKKLAIILGAVIIVLGSGLLSLNLYIGSSVKDHIKLSQEVYGGTAEEALIAYLMDEDNTMEDRTHKAIWTLGQIRSAKALPLLRELYQDDPEGETCKGHHDSLLCQYELLKAIRTIEKGGLTHARLNR